MPITFNGYGTRCPDKSVPFRESRWNREMQSHVPTTFKRRRLESGNVFITSLSLEHCMLQGVREQIPI